MLSFFSTEHSYNAMLDHSQMSHDVIEWRDVKR